MVESSILKKIIQHIGLLSYGVIFFFAAIYYQERTLFLDNAFQVFLMIVDGNIVVNADRWPAVIVRALPFLVIKMKAPLELVLLSFSLSYWLFHFIVFLIIRYGLKEKVLSLFQLSTVSIPLVHSFFWCNSELNLALSVLILAFACYKKGHLLVAAGLSLIILWLHPLIFIAFGFLMTVEGLNVFYKKGKVITGKVLQPIILAVVFFMLFLVKKVLFKNWYDTMKSDVFNENIKHYDFINFDFFTSFFKETHIIFPAVFVLALGYTIYKKEFIKSLFFFLFVMAYLMLLDISKTDGYDLGFYNEVNNLIIFFASAFILKDAKFMLKRGQKAMLYVVLLLLVVYNWTSTATFYTERIEWISAMSDQHDREILAHSKKRDSMLVLNWGSGYESLVISTLKGSSRTFIVPDNGGKNIDTKSDSIFYGAFKSYPINDINDSYYFDLKRSKYTHAN